MYYGGLQISYISGLKVKLPLTTKKEWLNLGGEAQSGQMEAISKT